MLRLGIDIGSKTIKLVVINEEGALLYEWYERHLSNVHTTLQYALQRALPFFPHESMTIGITGSAGMQLASQLGIPFTQEVIAARSAIKHRVPEADVAIEIGGEDSKILFLTEGEELRMNSTCAGGTGGFIDTIAGMLDSNAEKLNVFAHGCQTIYPIASRCAVFAQMDVRPLLNEGVTREDIAGSVFDAVALQCIRGLACGRSINGTVIFLGGPLHFLSALRECFKKRLNLSENQVVVPHVGHLFVALGAAYEGEQNPCISIQGLLEDLEHVLWGQGATLPRLNPLFSNESDYQDFKERHQGNRVARSILFNAVGRVYLGIDSGSEAIKYALIDEQGHILRTYYKRSAGNLVEVAQEMFVDLWKHLPIDIKGNFVVEIAHATVTGYGEELLKEAFSLDSGEVETVAHVRAAYEINPDVDFILDIGGQDIKCVWLEHGEVKNVVLNEACSSGCGSLLDGMAWSMNVRFDRFLEEAIKAQNPVDLGTRCTVFMTSRVRHAQKEGASMGDISAGLAYSVVRNATNKVIRAHNVSLLGNHIVVQGGAFMNDSVLRAFEKTYETEVTRPDIAAYMGAYGAALIARDRAVEGKPSGLLPRREVENLKVKKETTRCLECGNACLLTKTTFYDGAHSRVFAVGNRCSRPLGKVTAKTVLPNLYKERFRRLFSYEPLPLTEAPRGEIGLIKALDMYEFYPFWHTFFAELGFRVILSNPSAEDLRGSAIETIPSESLCYPAKLVHAHVIDLIDSGVKTIFLPSVDASREGESTCPVLAHYPIVIKANIDAIQQQGVTLLDPWFPVLFDNQGLKSSTIKILKNELGKIMCLEHGEVEKAARKAWFALEEFRFDMQKMGQKVLRIMEKQGSAGVVLAGRPYHVDPALHHEIPALVNDCGFAVLTPDCLPLANGTDDGCFPLWEYPRRIVQAAKYAAKRKDLEFVLFYSFGCGLDAVTVDRVEDLLRDQGQTLTALKIDEMTDLAAIKIRIRSMKAAREKRFGKGESL